MVLAISLGADFSRASDVLCALLSPCVCVNENPVEEERKITEGSSWPSEAERAPVYQVAPWLSEVGVWIVPLAGGAVLETASCRGLGPGWRGAVSCVWCVQPPAALLSEGGSDPQSTEHCVAEPWCAVRLTLGMASAPGVHQAVAPP